jgi:enolase
LNNLISSKQKILLFRIKAEYGLDATNVGDEGGFAPNIENADKGSQTNI